MPRKCSFSFSLLLLFMALAPIAVLETGCGGSCWKEQNYSWELYAVTGCDDSSVFAVGYTIVRSVGSGWSSFGSPGSFQFYDVWCVSPEDTYAVNGLGEIWHFDGSEWTLQAAIEGMNEEAHLLGVWGTSDGQMFVVGRKDDSGIVLMQEGIDWTEIHQEPQESFRSIWGSSSTDIYVTGRDHVIHFDGSEWSETSIEDEGFWDVSGVSSEEIYILSRNKIWMLSDAGPSVLREIHALSLSDLFALRPGELYATGRDSHKNQVLRYRDGEWNDLGGGINGRIELHGIWASQEGRIVVVGTKEIESVGLEGVLLEYTCE